MEKIWLVKYKININAYAVTESGSPRTKQDAIQTAMKISTTNPNWTVWVEKQENREHIWEHRPKIPVQPGTALILDESSLEKILAKKKNIVSEPCIWVEEDEDFGTYQTSCNNIFNIIEGTPSENNFKYCCYCGKPLKERIKNERHIK